MRVRVALVLLAACEGVVASPRARLADEAPYLFAVVPQEPPVLTSARWAPIVERIARDAGLPLRLKLYERVEELRTDLASGAVDFAYLGSVQAVHAFRVARYRPLVRNAKPIRGVVFVTRASPFTSLESLRHREIVFAGPWSVCLAAAGHNVRDLGIGIRYVGTQANVYKQVTLGLAPAGGVVDEMLAEMSPAAREELRVVYSTPPFASHPVVVHPRVPTEAAGRLAAAFYALAATREGARLLEPVHLAAPVPAHYERDYAPLERRLGLAPATRGAE